MRWTCSRIEFAVRTPVPIASGASSSLSLARRRRIEDDDVPVGLEVRREGFDRGEFLAARDSPRREQLPDLPGVDVDAGTRHLVGDRLEQPAVAIDPARRVDLDGGDVLADGRRVAADRPLEGVSQGVCGIGRDDERLAPRPAQYQAGRCGTRRLADAAFAPVEHVLGHVDASVGVEKRIRPAPSPAGPVGRAQYSRSMR